MKTWLITGASSGLGLVMTTKLLERGDRVVACGRRIAPFEALQRTAGERLHIARFDLTDTAALRREVDAAFATFGRIDTVVSNAGYGLFGAAEEVTDAQIERQIATNLIASIQLVRAVLPRLREQGGGRIMQVSSEGGQVAYPNFSLYHATKWGIEGFLDAVAQEVAPFGIDIVIAEPGPTVTGFADGLDHAAPLEAYDATPAGDVRRAISSGAFDIKGDAERTVDAMIRVADSAQPRRRIALGSTAFENIHRVLTARLDDLVAQKSLTLTADRL
ncbi:short chain dehydrogenase [Pseudomonas daroniae]|uniref:Short chain dehydrogenase n=1 Tax=Phytopseudomonas daroniae TaxID=2487519 RepID=A0A4Q9QJI7_9GAMM|nr:MULTISPECIES: SDR family oxidoreductase [Pseudomonas]TBU77538.1 short chain dehydrogenase [Pseudomonas daroniae]TBU85689.1 short chain dehydrogenase [Pseudomonas sp. FRB 228]TBU94852.1 short chain dehydrogenase [Pseudomonas daroniae]